MGNFQYAMLGDCLDVLQDIPACEYDSLITDPPAGIGFMGKDWDKDKGGRDNWVEWMTGVMKECHRVLKPGAHGLVWALPRTSHWTATALENAGFEVRDVITHLFGSGFPKSWNISKAIDKAAGAEREVIGRYCSPENTSGAKGSSHFNNSKERESGLSVITAPATPEAKKWDGWGTALKPSNEHWILIRKPIEEKTVAKNVLKWGTGGINIEACRIEGTERRMCGTTKKSGETSYVLGSRVETRTTQGRFPANTVFSHSEYCTDEMCDIECAIKMLDEQSGISKGSGKLTIGGTPRKRKSHICPGLDRSNALMNYGDTGGASRYFYCAKPSKRERNAGVKELLTWENQDQNLVDQMEGLSQQLKDISDDTMQSLSDTEWSTVLSGRRTTEKFPRDIKSTIKTMTRLITEFKTWNSSQHLNIKDIIRDAIKTIEENGLSLAENVEFFRKSKEITTNEKMGLVLGASLAVNETLLKMTKSARVGNVHVTVKPKKLMTYLIKLITPPGGKVLDPFMGSGSTGVAAVENGFKFLGIEMDAEYHSIALKRINNVR